MEEKTPTKYAAIDPTGNVYSPTAYSPIAYSPIAEYEAVPHASSYDFLMGTSVATSHPSIRAKFLSILFAIFATQLIVIIAACSCFMYIQPLKDLAFRLGSWAICLLSIIIAALLIGCHSNKHRFPANAAWLSAFTLTSALLLGSVCALQLAAGLSVLILEALGLTLAIFIILSSYTHISRKELPFTRGLAIAAVVASIGSFVVNGVLGIAIGKHSWIMSMLLACTGPNLICMYVLYKASSVMLRFSVDEYVTGVIDLHLDVFNPLLSLLKIPSFLRR